MKRDLEKMRKQLSAYRGAMKDVQERSGYGRETVRRVLAGEQKNPFVLSIAAKVLKERKESRPIISQERAMELVQQAVA